jgi:hypothetical protein
MPYGKLFINLACSSCTVSTEKKDLGPIFPCTDLAFGDSLRLIETLRLTFTANGINFKYFKVIFTRFRQLSPNSCFNFNVEYSTNFPKFEYQSV